MATYWMISDRNLILDAAGTTTGLGDAKAPLSFWTSSALAGEDLRQMSAWRSRTYDEFKNELVAAANTLPTKSPSENEQQKHVTFFVHGFNAGWTDATQRYRLLADSLYGGANGLGICISFDWPSYGNVLGYYPDRDHAKDCAQDLTVVLCEVYDWLLNKQAETFVNPAAACKVKVSVIAHSMGNFLLQKAMYATWTRKNQPLLVTLVNQAIMIAADVDNDLFDDDSDDAKDGKALANLTYRITSLYSGRDAVLGVSAGLKHFGTRRLGRSGLATNPPADKDNVWEVDCSSFFRGTVDASKIHGAYFETPEVLALMRQILAGTDRKVLQMTNSTIGTAWPP